MEKQISVSSVGNPIPVNKSHSSNEKSGSSSGLLENEVKKIEQFQNMVVNHVRKTEQLEYDQENIRKMGDEY